MPEFATFDDLQQEVFACFDQPETLQRAYDLLEAAYPEYPEHAGLIYNWQYCAAALMGKSDLALELIRKALARTPLVAPYLVVVRKLVTAEDVAARIMIKAGVLNVGHEVSRRFGD